jgi:AraC-like DNA-binding protein
VVAGPTVTYDLAGIVWGILGEPTPDVGFAQLLHVVETDAGTLRHAFFKDGATVGRHRHDCIGILYVVGGPVVEMRTGNRTLIRRIAYQPFGTDMSVRYEGPTHVLSLEIPADRCNHILPGLWPAHSIPLTARLYDYMWRAMVAISSRQSPQSINSALTAFFRQFVALCRVMPPWLEAVLDQVHREWRLVPDVRRLAEQNGFSVQHFYRQWKKHVGVTPGHYSLLLRLDHARALIWGTDMPLSQIASEAGFADQSHLTRILVSHLNVTPRRLREIAPCLQRERYLVETGLDGDA